MKKRKKKVKNLFINNFTKKWKREPRKEDSLSKKFREKEVKKCRTMKLKVNWF